MVSTPAGHAGGRDKPHSGGPAGPTTPKISIAARGPGLQICGGLVVAAALVAASPLPGGWMASAETPLRLPTPGPLGWLWDAAALWLPIGERGVRAGFAALLLALVVAASAGWFAFHLYRGTGRRAACFAAVTVCAALLMAWLRDADAGQVPALLGFCLAGAIAVGLVVGARVHGEGSRGRMLVACGVAMLGATLWPRAGVGAAALLLGYVGWTRARGGWRTLGLGVGLIPLLAFGTGLFRHDLMDRSWGWSWWSELRFVPDLRGVLRVAGAGLVFPALALVVLLVVPLRWRGGGLLLALVGAGLVLADRAGSLAPTPALLVLVSVGVCGWIWLAGSVGGPWAARAAMLVVLAVAGSRVVLVAQPVATTRPEISLLALHQRGLVAPGDVLLAHDPWLAMAFAAARRDEGARPDLELFAASSLDAMALERRLAGWEREGRRVLSDSFNHGGRWSAREVLDSGPLFWSISVPEDIEREFTDLRGFSPGPGTQLRGDEAARWERLHVERARYRRALGEHAQAMLALPFTEGELEVLTQQLRLTELSRLAASGGSEFGASAWSRAPAPASAHAEAGDLLFALGGGADGSEQLERAADRGAAEALGALVRWQLRAGEEAAASVTLRVLAAAPVLRPQLLAVCRWLLRRARAQQAAELLVATPPAPSFAPEELGLRLATLRELAAP